MGLLSTIFGTKSTRRLARYRRRLETIDRIGAGLRDFPDSRLQQHGLDLAGRAGAGEPPDALLCECFALGREAAGRTLGMRHFDVQLLGGMALNDGLIAEMRTGEGKTLAATLPVCLNALYGRGVHVVTVNDYLARRDAEWMGPLYRFFGLTVGVILEEMGDDPEEELDNRRKAYACDITYGTNHEIAFDYLRDNLAVTPDEIVHRGFEYAIVDEVDFLLIDEARTPLIISGPAREDTALYRRVDRAVRRLREGYHYSVEAKSRTASFSEAGMKAMEKALESGPFSDLDNLDLYHAAYQSLQAHGVYQRDVDYIVEDGQVFIVDEFTGRVSEDKRYSDGLHQAIEAKERVEVLAEDRTVAKVTYQTFFGRYRKLAGMTGTAWSEREEFSRTYGLDVLVVPTHKPMIRRDLPDAVHDALDDKHRAVIAEIGDMRAGGRPVLVGTTSVRESEQLSARLKRAGIPHAVLNAKNHRAEAEIIAQAGRRGAVTISTNMAGRGVDILLGGNPGSAGERGEVVDAGGLHVIGTARHESVRIDDQLRGRAGRQGDPGSSRFTVSLDDQIWKKFGSADIDRLREKPAGPRLVRRLLRALQKKVELENLAVRRDVLKYDLVVHVQRETIYAWRRTLVAGEGFDPRGLIEDVVADLCAAHADRRALDAALQAHFHTPFDLPPDRDPAEPALQQALAALERREETIDAELLSELGRRLLLESIDVLWTDHLSNLERLEEGIGLRGYAQVDPLNEWRREATEMWRDLLGLIRSRAVSLWFLVELERPATSPGT